MTDKSGIHRSGSSKQSYDSIRGNSLGGGKVRAPASLHGGDPTMILIGFRALRNGAVPRAGSTPEVSSLGLMQTPPD